MTWNVLSGGGDGPSSRDLAPQRRQRIRSIVESRRAARLEELSAALGVSQATVLPLSR
jgi:Mn-dependent DtxR family transcriptional regulator